MLHKRDRARLRRIALPNPNKPRPTHPTRRLRDANRRHRNRHILFRLNRPKQRDQFHGATRKFPRRVQYRAGSYRDAQPAHYPGDSIEQNPGTAKHPDAAAGGSFREIGFQPGG